MMPEPCGRRLIAVRSVSSSTRSSVISQRRGKGLFRALRGWRHIIAPPIAAAMTSETKDDAAGVLADVRGRILRAANDAGRSEEHTSELQSLMRISYAVFCLKKKKSHIRTIPHNART